MSAEHPDTGRVAGHGRRGAMAVADPKTSAAATFALVFGLSSLFTALLALLAPECPTSEGHGTRGYRGAGIPTERSLRRG